MEQVDNATMEREEKIEACKHFVTALDESMGVSLLSSVGNPADAPRIYRNGNAAADIMFPDVPESAVMLMTGQKAGEIKARLGADFGPQMSAYKDGLEIVFGGIHVSTTALLNAKLDRYEAARGKLFGSNVLKIVFPRETK